MRSSSVQNSRIDRISYQRKSASELGSLSPHVELLDMIFFHITDVHTAFYLDLSNTQLLLIGERRIHQLIGVPDCKDDRLPIHTR